MVGDVHEAIVLEQRDRETGALVALTGNYVEVTFEGSDTLMRKTASLRVTDATDARTRGELAA